MYERSPVVLSHQVCGSLLEQPQETNKPTLNTWCVCPSGDSKLLVFQQCSAREHGWVAARSAGATPQTALPGCQGAEQTRALRQGSGSLWFSLDRSLAPEWLTAGQERKPLMGLWLSGSVACGGWGGHGEQWADWRMLRREVPALGRGLGVRAGRGMGLLSDRH